MWSVIFVCSLQITLVRGLFFGSNCQCCSPCPVQTCTTSYASCAPAPLPPPPPPPPPVIYSNYPSQVK